MKLKIFIFSNLLFHLFQLHGQIRLEMQKINVDSLQSILPELNGMDKINALNKLSMALCVIESDSCIEISNKAIKLSKGLDYSKGMADAYFNKGNAYFIKDSTKLCVVNYLNALRIYEDLKPSIEMGLLLGGLSNVNLMAGRMDEAIIYNHRLIGVLNQISEFSYESRAHLSLGSFYTLKKEYDSAFYYYDNALEMLESYPNPSWRTIIYLNYGWTTLEEYYINQNKEYLDIAISWFHKCLESARKHGHSEEIVIGSWDIGAAYVYKETEEDIKIGLEYIQEAIRISDTLNEIYYVKLGLYRFLAQHEYKIGNYHKAIDLCNRGLVEAKIKKDNHSIEKYKDPFIITNDIYFYAVGKKRVYDMLYNCYQKLGDFKKALEYYKLREESAEKITQENNGNLIAMLEAESENEKTNKKIALLAQDNELNEMKVAQSRIFNIGVAAIFLILFLVGLLFLRQNKLKNEHKSTLLEQKLLRLQMNPHFIFNAFSNILRLIDMNDNKRASAYLTTFGKLLRTTLESTREDMVPFETEIGTLRNYLELQKLRYPEKFEFSLEVDEKIDQEDMSIPPMLVQPFIENAIEHGIRHKTTTGRIDVRFALMNKKIICEVEDDGVGREKAWEAEYTERGNHKSLATEIIRDRIQVLNKKFKQKIKLEIIDIKSEQSVAIGTKVLLDLPYGSVY